MDLHAEIMNIQCDTNDECTYKYGQDHHHTSYKIGHRDARHAAAELALKAQARIDELESLLKEALPWLNNYEDCQGTPEEVTSLARIIEGKLK